MHNRYAHVNGKSFTPATLEDYQAWLQGYVKNGGMPTPQNPWEDRYPDWKHEKERWFVLQQAIEIPRWLGADAVRIIIPAHIHILNERRLPHYYRTCPVNVYDKGPSKETLAALLRIDVGHNHLYFMEGFLHEPYQHVPWFNGMQVDGVRLLRYAR
ncbi:MAG: hypothetical protein HYY92_01795 [Parcubacteria group bacterium]|nr:hypothetical protein [Parcubacteria group bacterium]